MPNRSKRVKLTRRGQRVIANLATILFVPLFFTLLFWHDRRTLPVDLPVDSYVQAGIVSLVVLLLLVNTLFSASKTGGEHDGHKR